jgi:hypothetical protein
MKNYYNIHTLWIAMLLLTLSTYAMGKLGFSGISVVLFLLLTAALKGTFIIRDFMELRDVSLLWRVIMYGWLWIICLAIAITYIISL